LEEPTSCGDFHFFWLNQAVFEKHAPKTMARNYISKDDCSHSGAHKEFISGQRTGEYICEECGTSWMSSSALEDAQENYRRRQAETAPFKRLSLLDHVTLAVEIEQMSRDQIGSLVDDDLLSGLIGNTNATGWGIDTLEVDKSTIEISPDEIVCTANAQYAGDQDEDSGPAGTTISGTVTIRILPDLTVRIEDEEFEIDDASSDDDW
jgi:hypothetical protein